MNKLLASVLLVVALLCTAVSCGDNIKPIPLCSDVSAAGGSSGHTDAGAGGTPVCVDAY